MSYLRLLAWLLILIVTLGIAVSMLPRKTRLPSSQLMAPNLETPLTSRFECVSETKIYPDANSLNLYIDFDGKEIKAGGEGSTNESLLPVVRGDYGYVDPVLYYEALATYLALFPVELGVQSRSYVIAPLPYDDSQGDEWVDNRTLCLSFPWLHVNPVEPLLIYNSSIVSDQLVWTPAGIATSSRLALTYLPSFSFDYTYEIERDSVVIELSNIVAYSGTNPVFKLGDVAITSRSLTLGVPRENRTLRFYAEDSITLFNNLNETHRSLNLTRRVLQLEVSIVVSGGHVYVNTTHYYPPGISQSDLSPHPGELWLARAYANATARAIESLVSKIDEYKDTCRYLLSAMLISSISTVEQDVSTNLALAIRDVLVQGKGSPMEKASVLSMILSELGAEHELKKAISHYPGVNRGTLAVYTYISNIPRLWQLPENLAKRENNRYIVLYDPWQNTVFCDHDIVEEIHESS